MGVVDGSPVNAANTNAAFLDANNDDTALGKIDLNNISDATNSGPEVQNIQRELNSVSSFTGKATNISKSAKPSWSNNDVGTNTDSLKDRSDYITQKFNNSAGHAHDGTPGNGAPISATGLSNVRLRGVAVQGPNLMGVTGSSTDVSTQMSGQTPSSGPTVEGVVVTSPNNVILRDINGNDFDDGSGNFVYGRITNSGSTWTLTYYHLVAGIETSYSFLISTTVLWFYQQLYSVLVDAPVYSDLFLVPSGSAGGGGGGGMNTDMSNMSNPVQMNQDLVWAPSGGSHTIRTSAETGSTNSDGINYITGDVVDGTSGDHYFQTGFVSGSGTRGNIDFRAGNVNMGTGDGVTPFELILYNVVADHGTGIKSFDSLSADYTLTLPPDAGSSGEVLTTDGNGILSWSSPSGAPNIVGSRSVPSAITAAGGISFAGVNYANDFYIKGNGGPVTVTATPSISAGSADGQILTLIGRDGTNTVTLQDQGNLGGSGLDLNGNWIGGLNSILTLRWDTSQWVEVSRR